MAELTKHQRLLGPLPTKRLGFSVDYGTAHFGYTEMGRANEFAGIYQKRYTSQTSFRSYGTAHYGSTFFGAGRGYIYSTDSSDIQTLVSYAYGSALFGPSYYGSPQIFANRRPKTKKRFSMRHIHMRFYWPANPQTVPQQAWRAIFTAGAQHWQSLTQNEKEEYNKRSINLHMTGYHLHQREWLQSNL